MASILKAGSTTSPGNFSSDNTGYLQLNSGTGTAGVPAINIDPNQTILAYTRGQTAGGIVPAQQYYRLNAADTGGQNITTQQGIFSNGNSTASSISGTTLTVGGTITGTFAVGQLIAGPNVATPCYITALGTGTGGAGTYTVSTSQTAASGQINSYKGVNLTASTVYAFEAEYYLQKSAGATPHTVGFSFGGSATLNNILYGGFNVANSANQAPVTTNLYAGSSSVATNVVWTAVLAAATIWMVTRVSGTVSVNAAGTLIPAYTLSVAPGGAYGAQIGSYFNIYPISAAGSNTVIGSWV